MDKLIRDAHQIIDAAINAVKPDLLIRRRVKLKDGHLHIGREKFQLSDFEKIFIIGAGKASAFMAREMEEMLGQHLFYGVVSVKYGHSAPCRKIRILEAGHPVIDKNSLTATRDILEVAQQAGEKDLVLCLLSGGGSALLEQIPPNFSLPELQKVFELLLGCGANIEEINTVRKHLSLVKGGQLARAIAPATCASIILSDVIGDPLESIASGPTAPDSTTFQDAWQVIEKYQLPDKLPATIRQYLLSGVNGNLPETLKAEDPIFKRVHNIILGSNSESLKAAGKKAGALGYNTLILSSRIQGEAREVAKVLAGLVQEIRQNNAPVKKPACLLMGGETTVTLKGKGKGGRNQELALAALLAMKNARRKFLITSVGTDGSDGPTDAAGGMVHPGIWEQANSLGLNPLEYLQKNNAYPFLEKTGGLIKTGPTGTNVMDVIFALVP
jgi:glycerate 2-kinase